MEDKLLIFDVDGVLIDSKKNMQSTWKKVQKKFKVKATFKSYFKFLGMEFIDILKKLNIKKNLYQIKKFYQKESTRSLSKINFFKDVKSTLEKLKKKNKICIVTSKDRFRTKLILNRLNFKFHFISCPVKNLKSKPSPDQILHVIKKMNYKKKNAYYIGDTNIDFLSAKKAKIKFIFATYGYGKYKKKFRKKINNFSELLYL